MGFFHPDQPGHEGFLVALVSDQHGGFRPLGAENDETCTVMTLQVGCECSWRSPRFAAPHGTLWYPCIVEVPSHARAAIDELAHALWDHHLTEAITLEERTRPPIVTSCGYCGWPHAPSLSCGAAERARLERAR